jgi:DNA-binding CsgD family transcriptional regulator/tetratricopeptide (TPR) repeat protein
VARRRELGEPVALGRALVALAWHHYLDADVARAGTVVDEAVAVLEPTGDASALALARSYRGFLQVLSDREEDGLAELGRVSSTGAADTDPLDAARSCYRGLGQAFLGDAAGLELLRRGVADAAAQGQREFAALGYTALVKASRRLGRDADVRRYAEQGLTRTRESDLHSHGYTLEAHLYQLLFQAGRWDEAEEGLRRLLRAAPEAGILGRETLPHLGRLLMRRGHPDADALLERAWALGCRTDILPVLVPAGIALLERAWLAGDPASERSCAELLLARTDRPGVHRYRGELLRYLRRCGWPVQEFAGGRPEHLLGLRGDWAGAAAEWARIGDPYERALELAESGLVEPTLEALGLLDDLEAEPAARLVRGRLRDLGVTRIPRGPRPATRAHPAGLTERQVDVLGMLGEGLTNAEIAARLVVSVRTVDHHVSAVLTKLGVPTRRDAARLAGQLG